MQAAAAIADPVRREILALLRDGPQPAGAIAARFDISRPAVSRHLRVLRECGLVRDEVVGRQRRYSLDPSPLEEVASYVASLLTEEAWERRFDALETEVRRTRKARQPKEQTA